MQVRAPLSTLVNNQKVVLMGCEDLREYTTNIVDGNMSGYFKSAQV